jgi:hypothetical protein
MVQIVAVLLGLFGGAAGWFAANFLGKSLVQFFELRALVYEEMLFSADLTPELELPLFNASGERLRRIASRLKSLEETALPVVRQIWEMGGYDPADAADAIVRYAYSYDRAQRRKLRSNIEKALRFKLWTDPPASRIEEVLPRA